MSKKIITPQFRVSFPHIMNAAKNMQGNMRYSLVMLFPKSVDLSKLKEIAREAAVEKWGDKIPEDLKHPFRDGNSKTYDGYKDTIFCSTQSVARPGLVDENKQTIIAPEDFYAGCYAIATITAYAYDVVGNKGVSFGLQNVMKVKDGEPFSGKSTPQDDFDSIPGGEQSEDNKPVKDLFKLG